MTGSTRRIALQGRSVSLVVNVSSVPDSAPRPNTPGETVGDRSPWLCLSGKLCGL